MLLTGFVQFVAVVVAVEHLDGSAVAAKYTDQEGKRKWITHAYAEKPFDDTPMPERTKQLMEVEKYTYDPSEPKGSYENIQSAIQDYVNNCSSASLRICLRITSILFQWKIFMLGNV